MEAMDTAETPLRPLEDARPNPAPLEETSDIAPSAFAPVGSPLANAGLGHGKKTRSSTPSTPSSLPVQADLLASATATAAATFPAVPFNEIDELHREIVAPHPPSYAFRCGCGTMVCLMRER